MTQPTNRFQSRSSQSGEDGIGQRAIREFDALVAALVTHGVNVYAYPGRTTSRLPDEVFPNNWLTTHPDGTAVLYPMMAWNRRQERRRDILEHLQSQAEGFRISRIVDLSRLEARKQFLEGSGSLVFDHASRVAYANLSPRTHTEALKVFAHSVDYDVVAFEARDLHGHLIYHTNVLMALGARFALICADAITAADQRFRILTRLERSGREVIEISREQMHCFAGNMLELRGSAGHVIALSAQAKSALTAAQCTALGRYGTLVAVPVDVIEAHGGGSVRCMLAELFLPRKKQPAPGGLDN